MSGGGGKGGGKSTTTETTVPNWIRDPAARNLRRAEQVQQLEYMPYYGGQVAAFNENQTQAMQNNANAATAFGLLAPTDVMGSMPTPTTYANGMKGYGSIGLYDQALAQLTAANPDNMAAYNSLFGNQVAPINFGRQGGGGRGGGGVSPGSPTTTPRTEQQKYETTMAKRYADTRVGTDASGKPIYGYTGQDERATGGVNMSRAGIRSGTTPINYTYNVGTPNEGVTNKNYFKGKRIVGGR